jgi:hypothetical protein
MPAVVPAPAGAGGASAIPAGAAVAAAPATGAPFVLSFTVPQVAPGEEGTQCVQMHLPNAAAVNVIKLHNTLTNGSHHFIVTAVTDPQAQDIARTPCQAFRGALTGAPLSITQKHDDLVQLPDGVGYQLNAKQVMHLELHYINLGATTIDISAQTELYSAAAGAQLQPGSVLLVGTTDIRVPAHSTALSPNKYIALPAGMEDVKFYAITGHTHRFGTNVTVSAATAAMAADRQLYAPKPFDWEAPEMIQLAPHAAIPSRGGFLLQCSWNNTSNSDLAFGESATAEMCFFWGYYYPKKSVTSLVLVP